MRLIIVFTVLLGVSIDAWAVWPDTIVDERKTLELKLEADHKVQLIHRANPNGLLHVKIYDKDNVLMVRDRITTPHPFTKKYDFSQVFPGIYTLAVHDAKGEIDRFEIDLTEPPTENQVYTKVEKVGDNKFKLLVNAVKVSDIVVSIYDKGKLVYQDREPNSRGLHKIYTLVNIKNGEDVEFRITTEKGFQELISTAE